VKTLAESELAVDPKLARHGLTLVGWLGTRFLFNVKYVERCFARQTAGNFTF
jgi:hypothetical protein